MKRTALLIAFCLFMLTGSVLAQKLKYGFVNAEKLLSEMPEIELANKQLAEDLKQINDYLALKNDEYNKKLEDYQKSEKSLNEVIKQNKQKELTNLAEDIKQLQQNAQLEINKKKQVLYQSAIEKLKSAIAQIAKENGYRFIVDNSGGVLLYFEDSDNVENMVRKKLGIQQK
jgi:outer membrane protein